MAHPSKAPWSKASWSPASTVESSGRPWLWTSRPQQPWLRRLGDSGTGRRLLGRGQRDGRRGHLGRGAEHGDRSVRVQAQERRRTGRNQSEPGGHLRQLRGRLDVCDRTGQLLLLAPTGWSWPRRRGAREPHWPQLPCSAPAAHTCRRRSRRPAARRTERAGTALSPGRRDRFPDFDDRRAVARAGADGRDRRCSCIGRSFCPARCARPTRRRSAPCHRQSTPCHRRSPGGTWPEPDGALRGGHVAHADSLSRGRRSAAAGPAGVGRAWADAFRGAEPGRTGARVGLDLGVVGSLGPAGEQT